MYLKIKGLLHADDTHVMLDSLQKMEVRFKWKSNGEELHIEGTHSFGEDLMLMECNNGLNCIRKLWQVPLIQDASLPRKRRDYIALPDVFMYINPRLDFTPTAILILKHTYVG